MKPRLHSLLLCGLVLIAGNDVAESKESIPNPNANSGAVVVKITNVCLPLMPCTGKTMLFAKVNEQGQLMSDNIFESTLEKRNHYYLLGAKPGRYVAISASYGRGVSAAPTSGKVGVGVSRTFSENIFFAKGLVQQTAINVKAGELSVIGDVRFKIKGRGGLVPGKTSTFLEKGDEVQIHYAKLVDPKMGSRGATSGIKFYFGQPKSVDISEGAKKKILINAKKHLKKTGWHQLADKRLSTMKP